MSLSLPKTCSIGGSNTGLVGTIGVTLLNPDGTTHTARATASIYEIGGGCYGKQITFDDNWKGVVMWDSGGGSPVYASEDYYTEGLTDAVIADAVWDEVLTGATHNVAASAGKRLRQIGAYNVHDGNAQDGSCYSITLAATASASDHIYNRNLIIIIDGTGAGQTRTIADYDGTTKIAVVDRDWWITPDATSEYYLLADDTPLVVDHGVAQDGANLSITLRSSASAIDETYIGSVIVILASVGEGQSRLITAYDGTTKVATITPAWETTPTSASVYVIMPYGCSCVGNITDTALTQINTKLETNHGASSWQTATGFATSADAKRILGLVHENIYIDNPSFDVNNNLTSARLRIYSVAGSVGTASDVLGTYTITAAGNGTGKFTTWKMVKE